MTDITQHQDWPAAEAAKTALTDKLKNNRQGRAGFKAEAQAYVDAYNVCAAATGNALISMADYGF